jgi:hypothetical protein
MNKNLKYTLLIIFLLMVVSGLLIYYLYLKPETFYAEDSDSQDTSQPDYTCPPPVAPLPASVLSSYYGVGFNIYPVDNTTSESIAAAEVDSSSATAPKFLIEHIPVVYNGTMGSMYSVTEGQLTLKLRNDSDNEQWWSFVKHKDSNNNIYYSIIPFNLLSSNPKLALQYENGNLALRVANKNFINQQWITTTNKINRGIPALNYSPASLFTPEFNPYSGSIGTSGISSGSGGSMTSSNLSQQNNQQVADVINVIKSNIQQYIDTVSRSSGSTADSSSGLIPPVSSSSLGNKDLPLNINVNLGGTGVSRFADITGTTTSSDLMSLLNKYEKVQSATTNSNLLFSGSDLQSVLQNNEGCSTLNIGDYTSNRVSTCNCKI